MHISELDTPALVIDLDIMERNLRRVGGLLQSARPAAAPAHQDAQSSGGGTAAARFGRRGPDRGKVGEAEVMLGANPPDLLVAYPVIGPLEARSG